MQTPACTVYASEYDIFTSWHLLLTLLLQCHLFCSRGRREGHYTHLFQCKSKRHLNESEAHLLQLPLLFQFGHDVVQVLAELQETN